MAVKTTNNAYPELLSAYPRAVSQRTDGAFRVLSDPGGGQVLGVGLTRAGALDDAARAVERPPAEKAERVGSPTWSLKSDEQYWKRG